MYLSLNSFKAYWLYPYISKSILNCSLFKCLLTNKEKVLKEGSNIILWLKRSNYIHNSNLLLVLLLMKTTHIKGL
jgi:hypothetical protein